MALNHLANVGSSINEAELKDLQEKFLGEDFRNENHSCLFENLSLELKKITEVDTYRRENLLDIFRVIRNCCIQCPENQNLLLKTDIPDSVLQICLSEIILISTDHDKTLSCGLQFLGNLTAGNAEAQNYIFNSGFPNLFTKHLTGKYSPLNESHFKICSMVLYNCLDEGRVRLMLTDPNGLLVIKSLCEALTLFSQLDWVVLSVSDHLLKDSEFVPFVLSKCSFPAQHHVLGIYCDFMDSDSNSKTPFIQDSSVVCLINCFLQRFMSAKKGNITDDFLLAFGMLIKALCWMTANATPGQWSGKVNEMEFVRVVVKLLADVASIDEDSIEWAENDKILAAHLASSFGKRDLVRLIGNLCYNNPAVQNQVRSLGGISLVLQACSIDDDNPFNQQWAVFAIRNLCQDNEPNQAEIAKLEKLGIADSPVLKSMGLTAVQDENGKLRVVRI